ncbi:hypothetical protein [Streptomyces johnsoniae]|uniref:PQQ-binding-like beta-propeller repeat protein n=1 Tax=Streptomyces johnsoniae TaxID=3075532 RepID=A0ABU2S8I0_9ACTN|nr:hypothetical protein [Streptomyces sp. DSM 41886]MDT0445287.1 hypothetical protein [Streptomyces sp. DSM 41886]
MPSLYDTGRGWESSEEGTQFVLPRSEAVGVYWERQGEYGFTVLDAATGETRWSSVPISPVEHTDVPFVVVTVDGKEYLAAWSSGTTDSDAVNIGRDIVSLDIFPAEASGDAVQPLHVEVDGDGDVRDGGAGLLVRGDGDTAVAVDPATGDTTEYDINTLEPPSDCPDCESSWMIVGLTANGPLLGTQIDIDYSGFWVPGGWATTDLRPEGADPEEAPSLGVAKDNLLVAGWDEAGDSDAYLWTVVDSASGQTLATVRCEGHMTSSSDTTLSANGRYLAHGARVFDLQGGTGECHQRTDTTNQLRFEIVTDEGMAFGYSSTDSPVQLDMTTGEIEELDDVNVHFPFGDTAGFGLFWDDAARTMVAYPHS